MAEERRTDREMVINQRNRMFIYFVCNKSFFFTYYSLRVCFINKKYVTFCELFKSLRYILKIRREGIKRIKTLHYAEKKTPMTVHLYDITTT